MSPGLAALMEQADVEIRELRAEVERLRGLLAAVTAMADDVTAEACAKCLRDVRVCGGRCTTFDCAWCNSFGRAVCTAHKGAAS